MIIATIILIACTFIVISMIIWFSIYNHQHPEKVFLFGFKNISFVVKELVKIYSNEKSFFMKKRIESGVAFVVAQWGMIHWLLLNVEKLDIYAICLWAGLEFTVCGYVISKIEQEKKIENGKPTDIPIQ